MFIYIYTHKNHINICVCVSVWVCACINRVFIFYIHTCVCLSWWHPKHNAARCQLHGQCYPHVEYRGFAAEFHPDSTLGFGDLIGNMQLMAVNDSNASSVTTSDIVCTTFRRDQISPCFETTSSIFKSQNQRVIDIFSAELEEWAPASSDLISSIFSTSNWYADFYISTLGMSCPVFLKLSSPKPQTHKFSSQKRRVS